MADDPITAAVNTGVTIIHLIANHAAVTVEQGGYANGMPDTTTNSGSLAPWSPKRIDWRWDSGVTPWYDITHADYKFAVGANWMYQGRYIDQATVTLDIDRLPPDFTVDVRAHFPSHGLPMTGGVVGLTFTISVECKYFLGQLVGFTKTLNPTLKGDGTWS